MTSEVDDTKKAKSTSILQATHGSSDHPLRIADIEIPCYVLEDTRRVIVRNSLLTALDMSEGTASLSTTGDRLVKFISTKGVKDGVTTELAIAIKNPIPFRTPTGGTAFGYEATVLADLCEAVLQSRHDGRLHKQQHHIADRCEILVRGFARVGIIALVDEATGFQDVRAREALEEILSKYISAELAKWVKTFPDEYYRQLFRLRGINYSQIIKRPRFFGKLTNNIIYKRLAPSVLDELKRITPKDSSGRRKVKFHQHLTLEIGVPELKEHLAKVIVLMKVSPNYKTFYRLLERAMPQFDHAPTLGLIIDDDIDVFDDENAKKTKKRAKQLPTEAEAQQSPTLFAIDQSD